MRGDSRPIFGPLRDNTVPTRCSLASGFTFVMITDPATLSLTLSSSRRAVSSSSRPNSPTTKLGGGN